ATSPLSGVRSNRLSYSPEGNGRAYQHARAGNRALLTARFLFDHRDLDAAEQFREQVVERGREHGAHDLQAHDHEADERRAAQDPPRQELEAVGTEQVTDEVLDVVDDTETGRDPP